MRANLEPDLDGAGVDGSVHVEREARHCSGVGETAQGQAGSQGWIPGVGFLDQQWTAERHRGSGREHPRGTRREHPRGTRRRPRHDEASLTVPCGPAGGWTVGSWRSLPSVHLHVKLYAGDYGIMLLCLCNYIAYLSKINWAYHRQDCLLPFCGLHPASCLVGSSVTWHL